MAAQQDESADGKQEQEDKSEVEFGDAESADHEQFSLSLLWFPVTGGWSEIGEDRPGRVGRTSRKEADREAEECSRSQRGSCTVNRPIQFVLPQATQWEGQINLLGFFGCVRHDPPQIPVSSDVSTWAERFASLLR
jgi:hypothetical protein